MAGYFFLIGSIFIISCKHDPGLTEFESSLNSLKRNFARTNSKIDNLSAAIEMLKRKSDQNKIMISTFKPDSVIDN